jgi:hypothetical protein
MNDRLKVTGRISDDMKKRLGTFTYYDTAGMVIQRQKYVWILPAFSMKMGLPTIP